ncbi:hypothetical protein D3C86_2051030 [compost metagenome]
MGAIIFDKEGARVESIKGAISSVAEVIGETAAKVMDKPLWSKGKDQAEKPAD